jgi:hypothetical protein
VATKDFLGNATLLRIGCLCIQTPPVQTVQRWTSEGTYLFRQRFKSAVVIAIASIYLVLNTASAFVPGQSISAKASQSNAPMAMAAHHAATAAEAPCPDEHRCPNDHACSMQTSCVAGFFCSMLSSAVGFIAGLTFPSSDCRYGRPVDDSATGLYVSIDPPPPRH